MKLCLVIIFVHQLLKVTQAGPIAGCKVLDLTQVLDDETPVYRPTYDKYFPFKLEKVFAGPLPDMKTKYLSYNSFCMFEHMGTHMDAPVHFFEDKNKLEQVTFDNLVGEACVLDVEAKRKGNPAYSLTKQDVLDWESQHGKIGAECIVLLNTGQSKVYTDHRQYLNTATPEDSATYNFSSFTTEAASYMAEAGAKAFGVDSMSLDYGVPDHNFGAHHAILGQNIPGFENMNNLHRLPPRGATVFVAPMLNRGGTGGPVRAFAMGWQKNDPCSVQNMQSGASKLQLFQLSFISLLCFMFFH